MLMTNDEGFGVKCVVTVDPNKSVKDTALLCANNPLGLSRDQYCWIRLPEGKRYCRVETRNCAGVGDADIPPIQIFGAVQIPAFETDFGSATKQEFENSKLKTRNALAAAQLKGLSWFLAVLGVLNVAKVFDSNPPHKFAHLDRVTIPTWLLLLGSLVSAFFDWRAEQRKEK
jgi:hypothetical protein